MDDVQDRTNFAVSWMIRSDARCDQASWTKISTIELNCTIFTGEMSEARCFVYLIFERFVAFIIHGDGA